MQNYVRWRILCVFVLISFLWGCGDDKFQDEEELSEPMVVSYVTPDPGPRYFPAPTKEFFSDPTIHTLPPEDERAPLVLKENVYWLADHHAETVLIREEEHLEFPLEGNEAMLGYEVGHILLNKWSSIHHYIENIEITDSRIILRTRSPELNETAHSASVFLEIEPKTDYPFGFDPLDVYFFENREEQMVIINEKIEHLKKVRESQYRVRRQELALCSDPRITGANEGTTEEEIEAIVEAGKSAEHPMFVCNNLVKYDLVEIPEANIDDNGNISLAADVDRFKREVVKVEVYDEKKKKNVEVKITRCLNDETLSRSLTECPCLKEWSADHCAAQICKGVCGIEEKEQSGGDEDANWGGGGSLSFCLNTDTNPDDTTRCPGDFGFKKDHAIQLGPDVFNLTIRPIFMATIGMKFKFKVEWLKATATLGIYAGIGYGVNAALKIGTGDGEKSWEKRWYLSEILAGKNDDDDSLLGQSSALVTIPLFFGIQLEIDPYINAEAHVSTSLKGGITYEYYDEKWFYACLKMSTTLPDPIEFITNPQERAQSVCDLPKHEEKEPVNDFLRDSMEMEFLAGMALGIGVEIRPNTSGVSALSRPSGIWFEPIRVLGSLQARLRGPNCFWKLRIWFGGAFGAGVTFKVFGLKLSFRMKEIRWVWPIKQLMKSGKFEGGIWESVFGCGVYDEVPPYEGDTETCGYDYECAERGEPDDRCFSAQCVSHGPVRVSMNWMTPGVNLGLFVKDPAGQVHRAPVSEAFTRASDGTDGNVFIENAVFQDGAGKYEVWVGLLSGGEDNQNIPFSIEVERDGETRQLITGSIDGTTNEVSPTVFTLCSGTDPSCAVD